MNVIQLAASISFMFSAAIFSSVSFAAGTHSVAWGDQFGTDLQDLAKGIAIDEFGDVYVSGVTVGVLAGVSQGLGDAYIRKSNGVTGELIWTGVIAIFVLMRHSSNIKRLFGSNEQKVTG